MFLKHFLNTISSVHGAMIPAFITINQGSEEIISCTACSFAAWSKFSTKVIIIFDIIMVPNPINQYFTPVSIFSKNLFLNFFHSFINSFLKIKNRINNKTIFEKVDKITWVEPDTSFMLKMSIGIN